MSFAHKLQYAGSDPFEPEEGRDDITHEEYELLTQDETYVRLAEVRYLADELESDLAHDVAANWAGVHDALFDAVAIGPEAPLQAMVDEYVDHWLEAHRNEVSA